MRVKQYLSMMAYSVLLMSIAKNVIASSSDPLESAISTIPSATVGHGRVQVQGSILDAACAMSTDSKIQSIDLGLVSSQELSALGYGPEKKLAITLEHCTEKNSQDVVEWKNINATFIGTADANDVDLFSLYGGSTGVGIQIKDSTNRVIRPGETIEVGNISKDIIKLIFSVRLASDSKPMSDGIGSATIKLKINYD